MNAPRAPLFARVLVGLSLALTLITAGHGVFSVGHWNTHNRGRSVREQRANVPGVAWYRTEFTELLDRLAETLPPEARLLVEPAAAPGVTLPPERVGSPPRWYLALTHYAWPVRVHVRRPELAVIFFTYEQWLDHHFDVLDLDGAGPATPAARAFAAEEERAIEALDIEWRLRIPAWPFTLSGLRLDRRVDGVWVEQEDFPRPEWGA